MKRINKYLLVACICIGISVFTPQVYGQLNRQLTKKKVSDSNLSELTGSLKINRVKKGDYKNLLVKDISKATTKKMKVAGSYFNKKVQGKWKITPLRPFGSGNLGFSMYSGQLWRQYFFVEGHLRGNEPVAYSGHISFDARRGRTYLIKVITGSADGNVYLDAMAGTTPFRVHGQNGSYPILIEANQTGELKVAISARHRVGQNKRFPEPLLVKEITIDEL